MDTETAESIDDPTTAPDADLILSTYVNANWLANQVAPVMTEQLSAIGEDMRQLDERVHQLSVLLVAAFLLVVTSAIVVTALVIL